MSKSVEAPNERRVTREESEKIGRFAVALCIGLETHLKREEERARIREGGFVVELAASSPA